MIRRIHALIEKAHSVSPMALLCVNLALAVFTTLAHGLAWLAVRAKATPEAGFVESIARVSLPVAAFMALSAMLALALPRGRVLVLRLHGIVLFGAAFAGLLWGIDLLANGIHFNNFTWTPGFFSALLCYGAFVFARFTLSERLRALPFVFYLPAWLLVIAVPIDIGVFLRAAYEMGRRFGGM